MKTQQIRDYILLMLGAPVISVDLSKEEIDKCIQWAENEIVSSSVYIKKLQDGALIHAKKMLSKKISKKHPLFQVANEYKDDLKEWKKGLK